MTRRHAKQRKKRPGTWWSRFGKWLGIAGLLGIAAGGALVVRNERQRRALTPDQVRRRLHERAARMDRPD
ncbi:MAG: hypothetical protein GXX86_07725 [Propionibacterium sp.]|nr:hypothetical protein [Propionibacterium sp.]